MNERKLKKYDEWLSNHFEEIVEKYSKKTIVLYEDEILYVSDTVKEAYQYILRKFSGKMPLVFTVPSEEDFVCLL